MFIAPKVLPISANLIEPVEESFEQKPVNLRLPIGYQTPQREIIVVQRTDYTPLLAFLGFLVVIFGAIVIFKR